MNLFNPKHFDILRAFVNIRKYPSIDHVYRLHESKSRYELDWCKYVQSISNPFLIIFVFTKPLDIFFCESETVIITIF